MEKERPKVGVGAIIVRDGKFLMGFRKSSHGSGTWCPPGGHLEHGESPEDCAKREVSEEAGIRIKNVRFGFATNDIWKEEEKHYITLNMIAEWDSGEPTAMEPEKTIDWRWFSWDDLPKEVFLTVQNMVKAGYRPEGL